MQFQWLDSLFAAYGAVALGLVASVLLFVAAKREIARVRRQASESKESAEAVARNLAAELEALRGSVRKVEEAPPAPPPVPGLNLTKRAQALRMYRRGELLNSIAAALQAPLNEIELLLKVQELAG